MITGRDLIVAFAAASAALGIAALAAERPPVMRSSAFEWTEIAAKPTKVGAVRQFFRAPTATLDELELHVTTLNPGQTSHAPHVHAGEWEKLGPGSVIFNAPNELHGLKSVGDVPAVYHVINWKTPATPTKAP